jgi:hypothetical protein
MVAWDLGLSHSVANIQQKIRITVGASLVGARQKTKKNLRAPPRLKNQHLIHP